MGVNENSVDIVCEEPGVPKRISLKQRLTRSLKKSSLLRKSSGKQTLHESEAGKKADDEKRKNALPDQDSPTSITLESKQTLEKEMPNPAKESTSLVESSAPEHTVHSPKSLKSEDTAQDVHAHTGEIIPSSPPPPYNNDFTSNNEGTKENSVPQEPIVNNPVNTDQNQINETTPPPYMPSSNQNSTPYNETQELIVNNSGNTEQNQNINSISSPTHESVLSTLDKSIEAGNSKNLNEAENVICMNPEGIVSINDQVDVNNSTVDINLMSQDIPDDVGPKQLEQIREDSTETNQALETENQGLNSSNNDNKHRLETKKPTVSEPVAPRQCGSLEGAETQAHNAPALRTGTLETASVMVSEPPPTPPETIGKNSDRSQPNMTAGPKLSPAPSFSESILKGKENLKSVSYPESPVMRSKFYPATGKPPSKAEISETQNSTKKNNNVKDLVSKFNQMAPSLSDSSSQPSTDLDFNPSYVENEIKYLTASLFKDQYAPVAELPSTLNHQLAIPQISVRNLTQMFDSSDSSVATTPILPRKGSNVSVGYSLATYQTFRNYEGLHPYWSGSNTSGSDSDDSDVSFLPSSRRSSENGVFSDFGSDLSNDTDTDVIKYVGESVGDVINNGIITIRDKFSDAVPTDTESPSFIPSPSFMSETKLELQAQSNELSVDTVDFPAPPPPLSHEDTVEDNCAPNQSKSADLSTSSYDEDVNKLENMPNPTCEDKTATTQLTLKSSEDGAIDNVEDPKHKSEDQPKEESNSANNPIKKLERGKRSTISKKLTEETKTDESLNAEQQDNTSNTENETTKKITRKRGSTIKRKAPLNKSASRTSITSRTSVTSRTSQISEVGPDGIHYKPGFV